MDSAQEIYLPRETIYKNGLKKVTELTWKESLEDRLRLNKITRYKGQ